MSPAYERRITPAAGIPGQPAAEEAESRLSIDVVYTSIQATLTALKRAGSLATRLNARINVVAPQVVPYPRPLTSPPVLLDFSERRLRVIADQSPVDTTVRVYLCRDKWEALKQALRPRSLIVIGGRKTWWPTEEKRLAKKLRRAGHDVVFAETE